MLSQFELHAQRNQDHHIQTLGSDIIIEGEIYNGTSFISSDGYISTKRQVKINKVLKGTLDITDPIFIVTKGGELNGKREEWTHIQQFLNHDTDIFFLEIDSDCANCYKPVSLSNGAIKLFNNRSSYQDPFFVRKDNLHELYKDIEASCKKKMVILKEENIEESDNCLQFELVKNNSSDHVQTGTNFSLFAQMSQFPMILNKIELLATYNSDQLGEYIIDSGILTVYRGSQLPESGYDLSFEDFSSNQILIKVQKIGESNFLIDSFRKEILEIQLSLENGSEIALATFNYNFKSQLTDPTTGRISNENCEKIDIRGLPCENLKITDFFPKEVAAGVDDESLSDVPGFITIEGDGFGDPSPGFVKPLNGHVQFAFQESGTVEYFRAAEGEYKSWGNKKIVVRVPTQQIGGNPANMSPGANTGKIRIETENCESGEKCLIETFDKLTVKFGMFNDPWSETKNIQYCKETDPMQSKVIVGASRRNLVSIAGQTGYKLFIGQLSSTASIDALARAQVIEALDVWRCNYRVNVEIVDNITVANCRITNNSNLPCGNGSVGIMSTQDTHQDCTSTNDNDSAILGFDIFLNDKLYDGCSFSINNVQHNFQYSFAEEIPNSASSTNLFYDFRRILIHEFGHAFQLRHTNNPEDIMFSERLTQNIAGANNADRNLSSNDDLGGLHLMFLAELGACGFASAGEYTCEGVNSTNDIGNAINISVAPNPANITATITSRDQFDSYRLFDIRGKLVSDKGFELSEKREISISNNLANGIYFVEIRNSKKNMVGRSKIIIQR